MLCSIVRTILFAELAAAFSSSPYSRVIQVNRCRISQTSLKSRGDSDEQLEDMDSKIHSLNKMFGVDDESNEILIATSKRRRNLEREIELLSQLHPDYLLEESSPDSTENKIIAEFWSIWYGECGASNEKVLRAFEEELVGGGPSSWPDAEVEYLTLIEENCAGGDGEGNGMFGAETTYCSFLRHRLTELFSRRKFGPKSLDRTCEPPGDVAVHDG